jgi:predicted transglutaminase-like cysteine proteinase
MTGTRGKLLLVAMAMHFCGWGTAANASPMAMQTGGRTTQPIGHYQLCQRAPEECNERTRKGGPVSLTRALWREIVAINNAVNVMVAPRTDIEIWGQEEVWSYPDGVGDCEDYALEKRRALLRLGIPAGNLLMTVVRQPNGLGHAVLTVRTSRGDFVLDNLEQRVLAWNDTEYTYLKRQSETNSGVWVSIDDSRSAVAVGSVR